VVIRFCFGLTPLDRVRPWGRQDPYLHWFGLTDGWYRIEVGDHELLRYSPQTLQRFRGDDREVQHPYVDYYVVRLWEDVIGLTPMVMQPVPDDLREFVAADLHGWPGLDLDDGDEAWTAAIWHGQHALDFGYLQKAPRVRAWRSMIDDRDTVTVSWQHQDDAEIAFTGAPVGEVTVPAEAFLAAVRRFDRELMSAMQDRITELERAGPRHGVRIDVDQLRAEHLDRATWLSERLRVEPQTDWAAVRMGAWRFTGRCP
jgi:hypothetical protein